MDESILTSVKKMLGISEEYTNFDTDPIIHINSVLSVLTQLGVGPEAGFSISDKTAKWTDWLTVTPTIEMVKSYVYLKVRKIFDPPSNSALAESMDHLISELEFRLYVVTDPIKATETTTSEEG